MIAREQAVISVLMAVSSLVPEPAADGRATRARALVMRSIAAMFLQCQVRSRRLKPAATDYGLTREVIQGLRPLAGGHRLVREKLLEVLQEGNAGHELALRDYLRENAGIADPSVDGVRRDRAPVGGPKRAVGVLDRGRQGGPNGVISF